MEAARRTSLLDEDTRQMKAPELAARASSSRFEDIEGSTTEDEDIVLGTTDGDPTTEGAGSEKSDPPAC